MIMENLGLLIGIAIVIIVLLVILIPNVRIVPQAQQFVIERLGSYITTWDNGLHVKVPFFDRVAKKVSLKENVVEFPPQPVITMDNATISISFVIFYNVVDAKNYTYGVAQPLLAIENLTATTLRNIIGSMDLDKTLTSRDAINNQMRATLDSVTGDWGIRIARVEIKDIDPGSQIKNAMELQMKAEREKRATILTAEATKEAAIRNAEGMKQSAILSAEGRAEAAVKYAEGQAKALQIINDAAPNQATITIKSLEAFEKAADGKATKIIIPSDIQGIAGLVSSCAEMVKDGGIKQPSIAAVSTKENKK